MTTKTTSSKIALKPLFDNVLVKPEDAQTQTASGIILPESVKEKPQMGTIMAIGTGHVTPEGKTQPMIVKVGQKVMYKKWGGNEVKVGTQDWMIVEQKDILAVIE